MCKGRNDIKSVTWFVVEYYLSWSKAEEEYLYSVIYAFRYFNYIASVHVWVLYTCSIHFTVFSYMTGKTLRFVHVVLPWIVLFLGLVNKVWLNLTYFYKNAYVFITEHWFLFPGNNHQHVEDQSREAVNGALKAESTDITETEMEEGAVKSSLTSHLFYPYNIVSNLRIHVISHVLPPGCLPMQKCSYWTLWTNYAPRLHHFMPLSVALAFTITRLIVIVGPCYMTIILRRQLYFCDSVKKSKILVGAQMFMT